MVVIGTDAYAQVTKTVGLMGASWRSCCLVVSPLQSTIGLKSYEKCIDAQSR
jgi:hypothetical protein